MNQKYINWLFVKRDLNINNARTHSKEGIRSRNNSVRFTYNTKYEKNQLLKEQDSIERGSVEGCPIVRKPSIC